MGEPEEKPFVYKEVVPPVVPVGEDAQRKALIVLARLQVGVKEVPLGSNRGPQVDAYNLAAKAPLGSPWCASAKVWLHQQIGIPARGNAWTPSWYLKALVTHSPMPGDYALVWFPSMGRYGHTIALIEGVRYRGSRAVEIWTVEFNTNAMGSREGDQCARRVRPVDTVTCLRF